MKKYKGASLGILIVFILMAIGIYIYNKSRQTGENISQNNVSTTTSVSNTETSDWKTYKSGSYDFEIDYPKDFSFQENNEAGWFDEQNLYNLSIKTGIDYQRNTDFEFGWISLTVSSSTAKCYTSISNAETLSATQLINGISFHYNPKQPFPDDAMGGERGRTSLFATVYHDRCYRIEKLAVYRDSRGFKDPPYSEHFNEVKVNTDLDTILSTFKFIK